MLTKFRTPLTVLCLAAALCLASCSQPEKPFVKAEKDRQAAPGFSLKDATGEPFKLADYRGKVVLLNFWATWCPPCQEEIPWFNQFEREFKSRDFAVVGVSLDERGWDAVKPYIARLKVNYRVAVGDAMLAQLYGNVEGLPTSFLIDRQGRIARIHVGQAPRETYRQEILQLLGSDNTDDSHRISFLAVPGRLLGWIRANHAG